MASHGVPRVSGAVVDKSEHAQQKEREKIGQYQRLENEVHSKISAKDYSSSTFQLTSNLLTQNPEYYTIWNYRRLILQDVFARELAPANTTVSSTSSADSTDSAAASAAGLTLAQHEILLLLKEDLQFLIPLLKQYPKCYWIWNHRTWLLGQCTAHLPAQPALALWQAELSLVAKMLAYDSRNFHGWDYRRAVVAALEQLRGASLAEAELAYTRSMIARNLSNFSAWHARSQLIPRVLAGRQAGSEERKKVLDGEFELVTTALYTDPYDQSLWFYHQYLIATLAEPRAPNCPSILQPLAAADRAHYLAQEIGSVREMLEGADDCKWIYQSLVSLSAAYLLVEDEGGERDAGGTMREMQRWLGELRRLDPMREGRWRDVAETLG